MSAFEVLLRLVPAGERARYREELGGELADLDRRARRAYLLRMLVWLPRLRHELTRRVGIDGHPVRLRCRLGMHHWHRQRTPDNEVYRRCDRCGTDDGRRIGVAGEDSMAAAMSVYQATQ